MFFKFSILLLFFILTTNCMNPDSSEASSSANTTPEIENEIIEDAYKCFLTMFTELLGFTTENIAYMLYLGATLSDHQLTKDYFNGQRINRFIEPLNSKVFGEILNYHSKQKKISVQQCANNWKDDWIIVDSFLNCRQWISHRRRHELVPYITTHDLKRYLLVGEFHIEDLRIVESYIAKNHPSETWNRKYWIGLITFNEIFKHYCSKKGLTVRVCAEQRKRQLKLKGQEEKKRDLDKQRLEYQKNNF